jgi:hypothetical protein
MPSTDFEGELLVSQGLIFSIAFSKNDAYESWLRGENS